jgi:hypothetical protein
LSQILTGVQTVVADLDCMRGNSEGVIEPLVNMARRACTFKQSDLKRAVRATVAAGLVVCRVEIDKDGRIVLVTVDKRSAKPSDDDLDTELAELEASNGKN